MACVLDRAVSPSSASRSCHPASARPAGTAGSVSVSATISPLPSSESKNEKQMNRSQGFICL